MTPSHTSAAQGVHYLLCTDRKGCVSAQPAQTREAAGAPGSPFESRGAPHQCCATAWGPSTWHGSAGVQLCLSRAANGEPGHQPVAAVSREPKESFKLQGTK